MMNTPREREAVVERWLKQPHDDRSAPLTPACLDAETAASWADGTLNGEALEWAQSHTADCARCQALMAALMPLDAEPVVSVAAEPEPSALRRWMTGTVPISAAAIALVAVAVWLTVPTQNRNGGDLVRKADAPAVSSESPAAPSEPASQRDAVASPAQAPGAPRVELQERRPAAKQERAAPPVDELRKTDSTLKDSAARAEPARPSALAERAFAASAPLEFRSPSPNFRWRIASGSRIERTVNGGASWSSSVVNGAGAVTTGSSPSPFVCWLVGRGGLVLLTTDGIGWERVSRPDPSDMLGVTAIDGRTAAVTTVEGRRFRTEDGGASWTQTQTP